MEKIIKSQHNMTLYKISVNQLAEFSIASEKAKRRIIKQQLNPNKLLIQWYRTAKGFLKKFLLNVNDKTPLEKGIETVLAKIPSNDREKIDKKVSIEALTILSRLNIPILLKEIKLEKVVLKERNTNVNGVNIIISPDLIFKGYYKDRTVYGAIKVHVCKSKPFTDEQAKYVSTLLFEYLKKEVVQDNCEIMPELCLCLDVFADRITQAPNKLSKEMATIKLLCEEIKNLWAA